MTDAADGAKAVFTWWVPDDSLPSGGLIEQQMDVTANMMSWSGTLNPPQSGWRVSPMDGMGMYTGDHQAVISWGDPIQESGTSDHIVTN